MTDNYDSLFISVVAVGGKTWVINKRHVVSVEEVSPGLTRIKTSAGDTIESTVVFVPVLLTLLHPVEHKMLKEA